MRDSVLLKSGTRKKDQPFVARVSGLWEEDEGWFVCSYNLYVWSQPSCAHCVCGGSEKPLVNNRKYSCELFANVIIIIIIIIIITRNTIFAGTREARLEFF